MADRRASDASDIDRYDPLARRVHWTVALLLAAVVGLGVSIALTGRESAARAEILLLHRSIGLLIFVLVLLRVGWRVRHPPPRLPAGFPPLEAATAYVDHALLYLILVAMPLTGYITAAAAGHRVSFFGLFAVPPLLPPNARLSIIADAAHIASQFFLYVLVGLHVAAAIMHRVGGRHRILERMLPPRR